MQRMSDPPLTTCSECGAPVERVFHPVAIHFKGSGFYNTDYGKKSRGAASRDGDSGSSSESKEPAASTSSKPDSGSSSSTSSSSSASSSSSD
jgi:predicted nucleic acid-binding Zn ribbon protein